MNQTVQTPEQHRYLARLLGYDFTIQYRSGRANIVADALSRIHEESPSSASLSLISMPQFDFLEDLRQDIATNPAFMELFCKIRNNPEAHPDYTITNGLILHKGRIWIPSDSSFTKLLLEEFHKTPTGGHMGVQKALHRLHENFTWDSMRTDTRAFIAGCLTCQYTKYDNKKSAGLLNPLPIPVQPWDDLSMDFIVGLPTYKGHKCIFVVVDRFSKGLHLGMLPTQHNARTVANLFMDIVGRLHGMPRSIVSDRDPLFISRFWKELFSLSGTKLRLSSAYHPQSDGQTEVANRIIEQYLRAFVHQNPSRWGHYLLWAEWSYNTSCHSATGVTPFEVTFGKKPPNFPHYIAGTAKVDAVDDMLSQREKVFALLRRKLTKAQARMKEVADKRRRELEFAVGDWVLVKLRPRRQISVTETTYSKLTKMYYGPFQITARMGKVAYQLQLPPHSRIHNVFHVSLLKPYVPGESSHVSAELPPASVDNDPVVAPLAIIASKLIPAESGPTRMVLVQWKDLPLEEASWEE